MKKTYIAPKMKVANVYEELPICGSLNTYGRSVTSTDEMYSREREMAEEDEYEYGNLW